SPALDTASSRICVSASFSSEISSSWNARRVSSSTNRRSNASVIFSIPANGAAAANSPVGDAGRFDFGRIVQVAAVEDHRVAQALAQQPEIRAAELLPLSDYGQRIGALHCVAIAVAQHQVVALAEDT